MPAVGDKSAFHGSTVSEFAARKLSTPRTHMLRRTTGSADMAPAGARVRPPPERPFWHSIFVFQQYIRRVEPESTMTTTTTENAEQRTMQSEEHQAKSEATAFMSCTVGSEEHEKPIFRSMGELSDLEDDNEDSVSMHGKTHEASSGTGAVLDPEKRNSPPPLPGGGEAADNDEKWDLTSLNCEDFFFMDVERGGPVGSPAVAPATEHETGQGGASQSAQATYKKGRPPVRLARKPKKDSANIQISERDNISIKEYMEYCEQNLHEIEHTSMAKGNKNGHMYTFLKRNTFDYLMRSASEGTLDRAIELKRAFLLSTRGRGVLYCSCGNLQAMGGGHLHKRHRVDSCSKKRASTD